MVNYGPLRAEIGWPVSGTSANFNGFLVLEALLHGALVMGVSQTAALNRGRHLYSAGGHYVGHRPTFLVSLLYSDVLRDGCRSSPIKAVNLLMYNLLYQNAGKL